MSGWVYESQAPTPPKKGGWKGIVMGKTTLSNWLCQLVGQGLDSLGQFDKARVNPSFHRYFRVLKDGKCLW